MTINFEQFKDLAKKYNLIPIYDTLSADLDTPVSAFLKLKTDEYDFLFESVVGGEKWARYSFLGIKPKKLFRFHQGKFEVTEIGQKPQTKHYHDSPFDVLREEFNQFQVYQDPQLPRFFGGAVGYIGYDMVSYFENIKLKNLKYKNLPEMFFILTDTVVIFDNYKQVMRVVNSVFIPNKALQDELFLKKLYDEAILKIKETKEKIKTTVDSQSVVHSIDKLDFTSSMSEEQYCDIVKRTKDYIEAGDIFQAVLSLRFELEAPKIDPFDIYRSVRRINPSPYMYYLVFKDLKIVGASPEVLVRLEDGHIEVRPIAGTRKRGVDDSRDLELEQELLNDPKEKAEHIMLVDLGRNDVGRVAKTGTVQVDENEVIERYSHVMHLVSHVSGELADNKDVFDVIEATFPAGTLSGAPKIRAMEIIEELEDHSRGIYGGAIGYISFTKNTDLAITIRTAVIEGQKITIQAGAGIVYNSVPKLEYKECCNKALAMIAAIKNV